MKRDPYRRRPYSKLEATLRVLVPNRRSWRSWTLAVMLLVAVLAYEMSRS